MQERVASWLRYLFMLSLGLAPSLVLGLLVLFSSQADQAAAAALIRYQRAPPCPAPGAGSACRNEIAATVISTYTLALESRGDPHVVIGSSGDQTWDLQPGSAPPGLAPGQAIQAEEWQGQIVLVRGADGRTLETPDHPARVRALAAGTAGLARLVGGLGLLWALGFGGLFVAVVRPSSRIERPARLRPDADP
jgi:hypothetical protein